MSVINVQTSPLQAAREWRGISLVVAARSSGIPVASAEAIEEGRIDSFASIDEMIATTVLYAASLGIGRDEAMALLDRTIAAAGTSEDDVVADVPMGAPAMQTGGTTDFSSAVQQRSATLSATAFDNMPAPQAAAMPQRAAAGRAIAQMVIPTPLHDAPTGVTGEMPVADAPQAAAPALRLGVPSTPTSGVLPIGFLARTAPRGPVMTADAAARPIPVESAVVRAALEVDPGYRSAWEQSQSELEAWATSYEADEARRQSRILARASATVRTWVEGTLGRERADSLAARRDSVVGSGRETMLTLRNRLERSEHAPLLLALGGGIVLIAMLVAIGSMMGNDRADAPKTGPALTTPTPAAQQAAGTAATATDPARPAPMLKPSQIRLHVLNAGRKVGFAATVAERLSGLGYKISDTGNSKTRYATSVILYPPRYQREAERLARQTGITTMDRIVQGAGPVTITIVVV